MTAINMVVFGCAIVFVLDNIGFNVMAVMAGLGMSGFAFSMASQAVLVDAFSALCIFIDEPFRVGDFIEALGVAGNVEYIGIKTTRVRSKDGQLVILSNTELVKSKIHNHELMKERRGDVILTFPLDTHIEFFQKLPKLIEQCASNVKVLSLKRTFCRDIGEYGVVWETLFYIESKDINVFCHKKQEFIFHLLEMLDKEGIKLTVPTYKYLKENNKN